MVYRTNVSDELRVTAPPRHRLRAVWIALAAIGVHAGVFAAAFALRAPENTGSRTRVVSVLTVHVTEVGDFEATAIANARIKN